MNKFIKLIISCCLSIFILFIYVIWYGSNLKKIYKLSNITKIEKEHQYHESNIHRLVYDIAGIKIFTRQINKRIANVPLVSLVSQVVPIPEKDIKIPISIEYTKITDIFEQGECGSCWVFATLSMIADRLYINTNIKKNLSFQQILECFDDGCYGNSPETLLLWLSDNKYKMVTDEEIPYLQTETTEIIGNCKESTRGVTVDKNSIKSITYYIDEINPDPDTLSKNILQMKLELLLYGPMWAAMTIYEDFYTFTGENVYSRSNNIHNTMAGGHAVEIIGFYDFENNRYWICRSSWLDSWPLDNKNKNGIFKIKMGTNECGIESRCGSASPNYGNINISSVNISTHRIIIY